MGGSPTSNSRIIHAIHRLVLRTSRTALRHLWALAYRTTARAVTAYLTWGDRDAATYVRGGVGSGDFLPGLSDVDTTLVFAPDPAGSGAAGARARWRWRRLSAALPATELLVDTPMVYDHDALRELTATSALTYGLDSGHQASRRAAYFGAHGTFGQGRVLATDWVRTLERPGLYGLAVDWKLLAGPDRRPPEHGQDAQLRLVSGWLELLYWWRWAFPACADPRGPRTAALCTKLVAEPMRIWLWLAHGERYAHRVDALQAGLRRMSEEEHVLRRALDLQRSLPDSPDPPLAEVLPALVRISVRIAELLDAEARKRASTEVLLAGAEAPDLALAGGPWRPVDGIPDAEEPRLVPLADWRALVCPPLPDESFAPLPGDPSDPAVLGAAAACQHAGPYPALRADGLMAFPAARWWRTRLRAIQSRVTDPVSFALVDGDRIARFPELHGWSAGDVARRAVAEHRAWLRGEPPPWAGGGSSTGHALAMLFTAARAALLRESTRAGNPELALTVADTARGVGTRSSAARAVADEALERYREFALHGTSPPAQTVCAMRKLVLDLPSYRDADDR